MSYWVNLEKDGKSIEVTLHQEGGTFCLGGTTAAELNVTYNYSYFFRKSLDEKEGIRWLYGKQASKTIRRLAKAIDELGTSRDRDYWKKTPGNAGYALSVLLKWAQQHPEAVWQGD